MSEPIEQPPVHQVATFDQGYAELNAWVDRLIDSYRGLRAENTLSRELDIAGLAGWAKETQTTRGDFAELLTVAVVRLAEYTETDRLRTRAEQAEAERDRLRARLTGVAIHAHRLTKRIVPGTPAWAVLADLRAALDQPGDQEGTT